MGEGRSGHWLVRMEWRPAGQSVYLPLLMFPCTIKSRSTLLAPAHLDDPGKRAVKQLWLWWWFTGSHDLLQWAVSLQQWCRLFLMTAEVATVCPVSWHQSRVCESKPKILCGKGKREYQCNSLQWEIYCLQMLINGYAGIFICKWYLVIGSTWLKLKLWCRTESKK